MDYEKSEKFTHKPYCHKPDGVPFIGIFLIGLGMVFLFDKMKLFQDNPWRDIIISWPMLLIFIGVINVFRSHARFPGIILIMVGSAFLLPRIMGIIYPEEDRNFDPNYIWPLIIIMIGVFIVFKGRRLKRPPFFNTHTATISGDDRIDETAIFGGGKRVIANQNLKGGTITAIFGGVELDLSDADLCDEGAVIELSCIFGGATIIVKPEWDVQVQVTSIMGGFTDKRKVYKQSGNASSKRLIIKGEAIFGGGEIKSF